MVMLSEHRTGTAGQMYFDEIFAGVVGILLRLVGHVGDLTPAAVLPVVTGEGYIKVGALLDRDSQCALRPAGVEVKGEQQTLSGESDAFLLVIHHVLVAVALAEHVNALGQVHHVAVKFAQILVLQLPVIL